MSYIYMDLLKVSAPVDDATATTEGEARGKAKANAQYVMLGSYDLLYYAFQPAAPQEQGARLRDDKGNLMWLERCHELRHAVGWSYERHPVFLYVDEKQKRESRNVLNERLTPSHPLVITMVRIAKHPLAGVATPALDEVLEELRSAFADAIPKDTQMTFAVFWNLGNCDFMIASRPRCLASLRDALLRLAGNDFVITNGVTGEFCKTTFTSFSSYCAISRDAAGSSLGAQPSLNESALRDWLAREPELEFINRVDAFPWHGATEDAFTTSRFLFGDRDFLFVAKQLADESATKGLVSPTRAETVALLAQQLLNPHGMSYIRGSSLIPSIPMPSRRPRANKEAHTEPYATDLATLAQSMNEGVMGSLDSMKAFVRRSRRGLSTSQKEECYKQLEHCVHTLEALYKHALRLYAAAYQDDYLRIVASLYDVLRLQVGDVLASIRRGSPNPGDVADDYWVLSRVSAVYSEVMRFVAELQHLNAILAVSPHSYMETYYGSMRSLNASSKLWVAYNGVIRALCRLFPAYLNGAVQPVEVLLVPYRERPSQSSQLFSHDHFGSILVVMQINYKLMFDTRTTTFTIAHELGHYIYNQTRGERVTLLAAATISSLLYDEFADILKDPLAFMLSAMDARVMEKFRASDGELNKARRLRLTVLSDVGENAYNEAMEAMATALHRGLLDCINHVVQMTADNFVAYYEPLSAEVEHDNNHFADVVLKYLYQFLDEIPPQKSCSWFAIVVQFVDKYIAYVFAESLADLSHYEEAFGHTMAASGETPVVDPYQVTKLRTYWKEQCNWENPEHAALLAKAALNQQAQDVQLIFREIHADVFACMVLKYKAQDYLRHIASFADSSPDLIVGKLNLIRIMAVCEAAYRDDDGSMLRKWIHGDAEEAFARSVCNKALQKEREIRQSCYYPYFVQYCNKVCQSMNDRLEQIDANLQECQELKSVRDYASSCDGNPSAQANLLWEYWVAVLRNNVPSALPTQGGV